jgi:hypothetical protein
VDGCAERHGDNFGRRAVGGVVVSWAISRRRVRGVEKLGKLRQLDHLLAGILRGIVPGTNSDGTKSSRFRW